MHSRVYSERDASVGHVIDVLHETVVYLPKLWSILQFANQIVYKTVSGWLINHNFTTVDINKELRVPTVINIAVWNLRS